ncbi:MAG: glycerol kinase GlpK [Nannocystaceae bacterium]
MTDHILAIDQGTTGTTCLVVDTDLCVRGRGSHEFPQHFPRPGWVEHHPEELWGSVCAAIRDAMRDADIRGNTIAAIGVTNQRETSLVWSRDDGRPIYPAIVWQDRRTAGRCAELQAAGHEPLFKRRTGLVLDPYFAGTKLAWTLDHVHGARSAAERGELLAGTIDTYLLWRFTDGRTHATEPSNASRTLLWPLTARAGDGRGWDSELCDVVGVPERMLPEVKPCTASFGVTKNVPGLPDGIPIRGVAGDQQSALFGQACFDAGEAKCTYGTGAFVVLNTGPEVVYSRHGLLTTVAWQLDDQVTYALEGSAFMAGAVVQWLRDGLGFFQAAPEVEALAQSVPDSDGVVLVPAHTGLGAPHWNADARGLICGMTRGTTRAHIARAALEGIALQVDDLIRAMTADLGRPLQTLRVDGGAAANNLLMQIQADLLGVRLARPRILEATALGAVSLAGLGAGVWTDTRAVGEAWTEDRSFVPTGDTERASRLRAAWDAAVARA